MAGQITEVNLYTQQKHHNAPALQESQKFAPSKHALKDWPDTATPPANNIILAAKYH